jgi:hypothetical protein
MTAESNRENMFGKIRGRFDEDAARAACEKLIDRFVSGFASLSDQDKARAIKRFNRSHNDPRNIKKYYIRAMQ